MGEEKPKLKYRIRKMNETDLHAVAIIHKKAWREDHFSSRLTVKQLHTYYRYILNFNSYCFIAEIERGPVAFVVGGSKTRFAIQEFLKDNFFSTLFTLLINPTFIFSRIKNFFIIMNSKSKIISIATVRLLSIAVDPSFEGNGLAKAVIKMMEEEAQSDGHNYIGLSVNRSNQRAIHLYKKLGWKVERQENTIIYFYKELNK